MVLSFPLLFIKWRGAKIEHLGLKSIEFAVDDQGCSIRRLYNFTILQFLYTKEKELRT